VNVKIVAQIVVQIVVQISFPNKKSLIFAVQIHYDTRIYCFM